MAGIGRGRYDSCRGYRALGFRAQYVQFIFVVSELVGWRQSDFVGRCRSLKGSLTSSGGLGVQSADLRFKFMDLLFGGIITSYVGAIGTTLGADNVGVALSWERLDEGHAGC